MRSVIESFRVGIVRAAQYWQVLGVLYLANLVVAFFLILFPSLSLLGPAHRTAINDAADGVDMWFVLEMLTAPRIDMELPAGTYDLEASPALSSAALFAAILAGLLPFASWLLGSILGGGALVTYADAPAPFSFRRFLWGCRRWLMPFLGLGFVQGLLFVFVLVPALVISVPVLVSAGWIGWIFLVLLLLVATLLLAMCEYMYILLVVNETDGFWKTVVQAVKLVMGSPVRAGLYYLLMLLALLAVHVVFRIGVFPRLPLAAWLLVLIAQQVFIVTRLGARMTRLAGAMELAKPVPVSTVQ